MEIGKRIYYDAKYGNTILDTGERVGDVIELTVECEISVYKVLSERGRDTFDVLQLEYGQYAQDFTECNGYRVNPVTREIEFSYPDPNQAKLEPVFRKPLSEEVDELKTKNKQLAGDQAALLIHLMEKGVI